MSNRMFVYFVVLGALTLRARRHDFLWLFKAVSVTIVVHRGRPKTAWFMHISRHLKE